MYYAESPDCTPYLAKAEEAVGSDIGGFRGPIGDAGGPDSNMGCPGVALGSPDGGTDDSKGDFDGFGGFGGPFG